MANLLLDWLNNEVKLSRQIASIEDDFRDGYLFGELLHCYNQEPHFQEYVSNNSPKDKINNFTLLEGTMRQIGVPFSSRLAFDVMNAKPGVSKKLLYELKIALDRISKRGLTGPAYSEKSKIIRVINPSRPMYDRTMAATFENSMRAVMENSNDLMMDKTMQRFKEKTTENRQTMILGYSTSMDAMASDLQRKKEIHRNRRQHEAEFAEAWNSLNIEQWKVNQTVARERRELEHRVETKLATKRDLKKSKASSKAREEALNGIEDFNRKLANHIIHEDPEHSEVVKSMLIKTVVDETGSGLPTLTYVNEAYLRQGLVAAQKLMTEHREDGFLRQQTHDQRRRKFVRECETSQTSYLHRYSEIEIVDQLLNICEAEFKEDRAREEVFAQKHVILANRSNRRRLIEDLDRGEDSQQEQWFRERARREVEDEFKPGMQSQSDRAQVLWEAGNSSSRQESIEIAQEIVGKLVDVTCWIAVCRAFGFLQESFTAVPSDTSNAGSSSRPPTNHGNKSPVTTLSVVEIPEKEEIATLPSDLWKDMKRMFLSNLPISISLPTTIASNVSEILPYSLAERPEVIDSRWLLQSEFHSQQIFAQPQERDNFQEDDLISEELRTADCSWFTATVAGVDIPGFEKVPAMITEMKAAAATTATAASTPTQAQATPPEDAPSTPLPLTTRYSTPEWITSVPPKYVAGESIIATRCVANPLPDDPPPAVPVRSFDVRIVLCGRSDGAKCEVANALQRTISGIVVIRVEELIAQALELALHLDSPSSQPAPTSSGSFRDCDSSYQMALRVLWSLRDGETVSDRLCVDLIIEALQAVPQEIRGFVLADFPNTEAQSLLLVEALSGIDYSKHKPQPLDYASKYLPSNPVDEVRFDVSKCGLDLALFLDVGDLTVLTEDRVSARKNCNKLASHVDDEIVHLTVESCSVEGLQELYSPTRPLQTHSIDLCLSQLHIDSMKRLFQTLQVFQCEAIENLTQMKVQSEAIAASLDSRFVDPKKERLTDLLTGVLAQENDVVEEEEDEEEEGGAHDDLQSFDFDEEAEAEKNRKLLAELELKKLEELAVYFKFDVVTPLPNRLADILCRLWKETEEQSVAAGESFFNGIRDVRLQQVQRRRALNDLISEQLVVRDSRQNKLEDFRAQFNEIDADFRFDPDCRAELCLRTLELCEELWKICEDKKTDCEKVLQSFEDDSMIAVATHRNLCEGVALLQAEMSRFYSIIDILFDYSKSVCGYDFQASMGNLLEETKPAVGSSNGSDDLRPVTGSKGKEKAKPAGKGKDAAQPPVAYRDPVVRSTWPIEMMVQLPKPKSNDTDAAAAAAAAGAKKGAKPPAGKEKGKKGAAEDIGENLFDVMEKRLLETLDQWSQGTFTINRLLYGGDEFEMVCSAVENCIWHEVERTKSSFGEIRRILDAQAAWLESMELSLFAFLRKRILQRFEKEMSIVDAIADLISMAIEHAEPLTEEWYVAGDVVAIMTQKRIVPMPSEPTPPVINMFHLDRLNREQVELAAEWISSVSAGNVILEQDLRALLDKSFSSVGPLGQTSHKNGFLSHLTFPKLWRSCTPQETASINDYSEKVDADEGVRFVEVCQATKAASLRHALVPRKKLAGIDEYTGVVSSDEVLHRLRAEELL